MPNIELSESDGELLLELAEEWLWDVRQEARPADPAEDRRKLKAKQSLLETIVTRLSAPVE